MSTPETEKAHTEVRAQTVEKGSDIAPAFMRWVAEGRGEPEYLRSKYSEIPDFLLKIGKNPSDPVAPDFAGATGPPPR